MGGGENGSLVSEVIKKGGRKSFQLGFNSTCGEWTKVRRRE